MGRVPPLWPRPPSGLSTTWGATRAARCARESAERGLPSRTRRFARRGPIYQILIDLGGCSGDVNTTEGLVARAAYPLAIPGLAGPGSMMTVTLLTENYNRSIVQQAQTVGIVAICLAVVVLIFFAAEPVYRVIGRGGLGTMSRVMGLILSSIAVTNGVTAIKLVFGLD